MAPARPTVTGDLMGRLVYRTWIDSSPEGLVGMVLLTPGDKVPAEAMEALALAAGMADASQPMPDCLVQVLIEGTDVRLQLRDTEVSVILPAAPKWSAFVAQGNPVIVLLGTLPLAIDADRRTIDRHILDEVLPGRVWVGKTRMSGHWTADQLAGRACIRCGSTTQPLHSDGTIPHPGDGQDVLVRRCTPCSVLR